MEETNDWSQIKDDYKNISLLLGNGFSLMFNEKFDYNSLYEHSKSNFSKELNSIFEKFKTTNFEKVLSYLTLSKKINRLLNIDTSTIDKLIFEIKEGKWNSIYDTHPKPSEIDKKLLGSVSQTLKSFSTIFTTNYDLFLYYSIMNLSGIFGDMFSESHEKPNHLKFNKNDKKRNKYIFYLHGCLFLSDNFNSTSKIIKQSSDTDLLERIKVEVETPFFITVFVTEGSSEEKLKSISYNEYLSFSFQHFKDDPNETILIFGHSLSEQDNHIVEILDNYYKKCIICLYFSNKEEEIKLKKKYLMKFNKTDVIFVDSKTVFRNK